MTDAPAFDKPLSFHAARRAAILDSARLAVTVDRAATHGEAERGFARIGALWSALLGVTVTPDKVALLLATLKVARAWGNPDHADNFIDLAGYAACAGAEAEAAQIMRAADDAGDDDLEAVDVRHLGDVPEFLRPRGGPAPAPCAFQPAAESAAIMPAVSDDGGLYKFAKAMQRGF